jgi:lipopolysaccharide/colanic/teichoic acid biosynthesis glycosyltransferase
MNPEPLTTRIFDATVATLLLVIFGPVLALVAYLIKLDSPGPALFRQTRIGYGNRPFVMYKFRTMKRGAENEEGVPQRVEDIASFVFNPPKRDHRVTRIGQALRTTSLDEWPNLLNVVKGDMRLIGPRPDEPELVATYLPLYHLRHYVKPGITGLAQVNGRSNLTYHQMMKYDLDYVKRHSFRRDLAILARTIKVVAKREGAR